MRGFHKVSLKLGSGVGLNLKIHFMIITKAED